MVGLITRLLDVVLIFISAMLAHGLRRGMLRDMSLQEVLLVIAECALAPIVFQFMSLYKSWRGQPIGSLLSRVVAGWCLTLGLGIVGAFAFHSTSSIPRGWIGMWAVLGSAFLSALRVVTYAFLRRIREEGRNPRPIVVVGSIGNSRRLLMKVKTTPEAGFKPVAVFDPDGNDNVQTIGNIRVIHDMPALIRFVRESRVVEAWLTLPLSEETKIRQIVRELSNDFVNVRLIPDVRSLSLVGHSVEDILGLPTINLTAPTSAGFDSVAKTVFDRVFAAAVLVGLLPILACIAASIKFTSPGPIFFRQKRMGGDGREFSILKFRSMKIHTEAAGTVTQARRDDPRITRVGAFLRRTSLDELPQFINVLLGDMSVVGPRPHALAHDDLYKQQIDGYMYRYRIKPGITGWAQVNGYRGETDRVEKMHARIKYDLYYIKNWSFWLDMRIVAMTIVKGFIGKNAY